MVCKGYAVICYFEWAAKASSTVFNLIDSVVCDVYKSLYCIGGCFGCIVSETEQ